MQTTQILEVFPPFLPPMRFTTTGTNGTMQNDNFPLAGNDLINGVFKPVSLDVTRTIEENSLTFEIPKSDDNTPLVSLIRSCLIPVELVNTVVKLIIIVDDTKSTLFYGTVSTMEMDESTLKLTCNSFNNFLSFGRTFRLSRSCRNRLYDSRCQVNPNTVPGNVTMTVDTISTDRLSLTTTVVPPQTFGFFNNGSIVLATNPDIPIEIALNNTTTFFFFTRLPETIQSGTALQFRKGCNLSFESCQEYNNVVNYGGVPTTANYFINTESLIAGSRILR